ncbi:MAG: PepSY domain-containing protein [Alphaproteobacteria bacterium]|nr:PepSY domain-containing protein [Alphaproteobacteria bacterium]
MLRVTLLAACALIAANANFASAASAAKVECSKADAAKFKPQADLVAALKAKGLTVSKIKVEGGCYEAYATDAGGKKVNAAYNAETLEQVDNAEAGEKKQ